MGRVKKPARGVEKFNVKMNSKSLRKIFKKKKADAPAVDVDVVMDSDIVEVDQTLTDEQIEQQHATDATGEKAQRKNPERLKKHELPVHVPFNEKFQKGKGKKARKADAVNPTNIIHGRLMSKKKAKKLLREVKRDERKKERAEMAMDM